MALIGHILKAGLDPGPWTLDSGLWTLDSGFFLLKLYSPPRKKLLYLPPPKKPLYPTHETPPINISPLNIVCEFSNKQRYSPHPPPRKNLCLPFKTAPSQKTPLPPPQIKNTTTLESIEQTLVVSMFFHKSALKSNDPTPTL